MKTSVLRLIFSIEYFIASVLILGMVLLLMTIASALSDFNLQDQTSWLNPIASRFDFLNIEDVSLDAIFAMKDMKLPDPRIVVVNIGEVSPTPDGKIAALLVKLKRYGARVVGLDIFLDQQHFERFTEERQWEIAALKDAIAEGPDVVVVDGFDEETRKPTIVIDPDILARVSGYGFANLLKDQDEVVRRFRSYVDIDGERRIAFPVKVLQRYDASLVAPLLAQSENEQVIYYTGTYQMFQTPPIDDILNGELYAPLFKGAIVLVGFVNEAGLVYLGDTHKTPMNRKSVVHEADGTTRIGGEGPDMAGIVIHANIINMLLRGEYIKAVPLWVDWLFAFLLAYGSIVLYRYLRTKVASSKSVGVLITAMLVTQATIVFFLPIIAYFYFDLKISYNLMATVVLLFIPVNAFTTKQRFRLLKWRMRRVMPDAATTPVKMLRVAFDEDEPFAAYINLIHISLYAVHYAQAVVNQGNPAARPAGIPLLEEWCAAIPEIRAVMEAGTVRELPQQHFYRYLAGKKDEFLREARIRDLFFSTNLKKFNEFLYFEEWDMLLPHAIRMFKDDLLPYLGVELKSDSAEGTPAAACWFEEAECKVHRIQEGFVFAGMVPRQTGIDPIPVYYGPTVGCEPILSPEIRRCLEASAAQR